MHFSGYPDDNVLQSWTSSSVTTTLQRRFMWNDWQDFLEKYMVVVLE
jgi:hypothetical protein